MFKPMLIAVLPVVASACGGTGGSDDEAGYTFLRTAPSEQVLCSFVVGETTQAEVLDALGEPTNYSGDSLGSFLQYWIGSLTEVETSGLRGVFFSFDEHGKLDAPSVQQIPFPQCWRDQLAARDSAEGGRF